MYRAQWAHWASSRQAGTTRASAEPRSTTRSRVKRPASSPASRPGRRLDDDQPDGRPMTWQNWAGTATMDPARRYWPKAADDICDAVKDAAAAGLTVRALG